MTVHCDLQIHINGHHTFFLHESVMSTYCGKLRRVIRQERKRTQIKTSGIGIPDFPGGPVGFELVSLFCYNGGNVPIMVSNVALLYCSAIFLGMTERASSFNLHKQTEGFLENILHWPWTDIVACLSSTEPFLRYADSVGLVERLMRALLRKITQSSDVNGLLPLLSSSSSSPDTNPGLRTHSSGRFTPKLTRPSSSNAWWFEGLVVLPPEIIERIVKSLGAYYGPENNSLVMTNFLLHYLKRASQIKSNRRKSDCYAGLADTAVHGMFIAGKSAFSCRGLFKVLRIVSGFGLSKDCRIGLEGLIGGMLDQATLDDILVSGHERGNIYDVNLVARLIRVFVGIEGTCSSSLLRMRKVGWLVDNYLGEIAPDQNVKMMKFIGVAESLPESARDCFDGVYRAIDIFLESHPSLSFEERSRLCQCLNYKKLSLKACKELARNPKVPPTIAIQALMAQQSRVPAPPLPDVPQTPRKGRKFIVAKDSPRTAPNIDMPQVVAYEGIIDTGSVEEENQEMRMNLERMQGRVVELEKVCKEMKGQMSLMVRHPITGARALPRLC